MKTIQLFILILIPFVVACNQKEKATIVGGIRHVVLFKLQDSTSAKTLEEIKEFTAPLAEIEAVKDFEFGVNTSPEGLDKGFNYSLIMKFNTEHDRDSLYLPHPIHQEFVKNIQLHISDVIVFDLNTTE